MATGPVKAQAQQQPLHNFPLSLKWGQPYRPDSDETDASSDPEPSPTRPNHRVGSRSARLQRFSFTSTSCSGQQRPNPPSSSSEKRQVVSCLVSKNEEEKEEDNSARPWKLRPRKQVSNGNNTNHNCGGQLKEPPPPVEPKSTRLRESSAGNGGGPNMENKKEKRKFWIALSREEIEEDVFIMTGSRPSRRPRKRPKNVQKLLDCVFPGLWLVGTTADSYRLADTPVRR